MEDPSNLDQVELVNQWLRENGSTPENEAFVNLALEALEDEIVTSFEDLEHLIPAMDNECQLNNVINLTTKIDSPAINVITNSFFGTNNNNLQFEDSDLDPNIEALAYTLPPDDLEFNENTVVRIIYDNQYLNSATNLSVIATTAHEYIHVYLIHLYAEGQLLNTYPNYTELNQAFIDYDNNPNSTNGQAMNDSMHNLYDDFLDWITDAVYLYAQENNIEGASQNYCQKLVIGMHQYTNAFENLSTEEQNEYSIIATNEQNGNTDAKGNTCGE